ncbi:acyl-CoA N-acyltransferase [Exophiala viscosa]|uniref:Acyl-CoA N-acyltransferase n=1 Tax=Exophiala viscosa TaxID=2486360 RepID=A0AAN6DP49_9EURO|nr:acyl-CoA N-acyltransferase [Exophiala viscosa]KAI1625501.1 acyl-CoA N-acyltransferase [Exophiala viscosa]
MAYIRQYQDSDKDAVVHIFRETASAELIKAGDPVLHYASYLWCRPYLMLEPATCYVVDDGRGRGRAVGYILGVPDTHAFVEKYRATYIPYLRTQGLENPGTDESTEWKDNLPNALRRIMFNPDGMLHKEYPQLMEFWPAHLHIDVLPKYQKQGYGRLLIEAFCRTAQEQGVKGLHLLMAVSNEEAGKFYSRIGFSRFPYVVDNGASGEDGRDSNTIWLVKTL